MGILLPFGGSVAIGILFLVVGIPLVGYAYGGTNDMLPEFLSKCTPHRRRRQRRQGTHREADYRFRRVSAFETTDEEFAAEVLSL